MTNKELTDLTDQELLAEAKRLQSFSVTNAFFIGFLIGIIIFSVVMSSWGLLTLIPLYFIYRMVKDPENKRNQQAKALLKERNLKG